MPQIRGIIRDPSTDIKQVLNTITNISTICYYDSYSDTYCIPEYMSEWKDKDSVIAENWRFINGSEQLYLGDTIINAIVDDDPSD